MAREVLGALGIDQDQLTEATLTARECTDAIGQPSGQYGATYMTGEDAVDAGSVSIDDIERLPDQLGTSPMYRETVDDILEDVERTIFHLDAVNDGFEVAVAMSVDTRGRFGLTSRTLCGPSVTSGDHRSS